MAAPTTYLKADRQYDPWAIINICTLAQASGDAGSLVVLQGSGIVLTRTHAPSSVASAFGRRQAMGMRFCPLASRRS